MALIIGAIYEDKVPIKIGYFTTHSSKLKNLDIEIGGLITNGKTIAENVILDFLSAMLEEKKIDKLEIQHISEKNCLWEKIRNGFGIHKPIFTLGIEWIGQIRNTETGEVFNKNSSKTRATFRRKDKKLLRFFNEKIKVNSFNSVKDIDYFIKMAEIVGKKSYQYALNIGVRENELWRNMLKTFAKNNYFRGYLLLHDSIPLAYVQGQIYNNVFYLFATSFDSSYSNLSPGAFLLRKVSKLLVSENVNYIHFGYGDAFYKRLFGTESNLEASFKIYGLSFKAKITKVLDLTANSITKIANKILDKTGLLNKVKKMWRKKLTKS